jgi:hypothetical protein
VGRILADGPLVVVHGGADEGVPFLFDALRLRAPVAWVALDRVDQNDFVAQGNHLAEAVNRAVGATLLPKALPFAANVQLFRQQRPLIDPLTLVVGGAEHAPAFAAAVASLHDDRTRVVVAVGGECTVAFPEQAVHLGRRDIALLPEEGRALYAGRLAPDEATALLGASGGRYGLFVRRAARRLGEPTVPLPGPDGASVSPDEALLADPEELLAALMRSGDGVRALELAATSLPERVPEVLAEAGPEYQRLGLLRRLHLLLEALDADHQADETVLAWRVVAALPSGRLERLRPEVERWLDTHEAPELRARYAGVIPDMERAFREAERAAKARPGSLTLFQFGRLHPDTGAGVAALLRSVDMAEAADQAYEVARNAGALAERLVHLGRFREAVSWGAWALRVYDRRDVQDGTRRLRLLNNWAFASVLCGSTLGLEQPLQDLRAALEDTMPSQARLFRSTLAVLALSRGEVARAVAMARVNLESVPRRHRGRFATDLVRALVESGEVEEALRQARAAADLNAHDEPFFQLMGGLALGVALAAARPQEAARPLAEAMVARVLPAETRCTAALYWLLATGEAPERLPSEVRALFTDLAPAGLRALSGPPQRFRGIWDALLGRAAPLQLQVLGRCQATLHGEPIKLNRGAAEVLLLLAEHPEGLSEARLFDALFGDAPPIAPVSLRVRISRLRDRVPVSASPYRLEVETATDLAQLRALVASGRTDEAVELYRGPVLPESDAHGVRLLRDQADELMRQSVLRGGSIEATLKLANTLETDLEVWNAALRGLVPHDPRMVYVRARIEQLRRDYRA